MNRGPELLRCAQLNVEVAGRTLVKDLSFSALAGRITCILGRNGTGKTLTLLTLAGLRPAVGTLELNGQAAAAYTRKEFARQLAFVAQEAQEAFPCTVMESAVVGRHPHIGFWQWESASDYQVAREALAALDLNGLEDRPIDTLSGGERRRLAIATALTQDPQLFLLDEPTNHLDPQHQLDVLNLLRAKADGGCAIIMSLHDAGVAARFADEALLLFGDGEWLHGPVTEALNTATLTRLYRTEIRELNWAGGRTFISM